MYPKSLKSNDKAKQFTRGGQITFHNLRMLLQVNKTVWNMYLPALIVLVSLSIYIITPHDIWWSAIFWCKAQINPILELLSIKLAPFAVPYHGKIYHVSPKTYLSYKLFVRNAEAVIFYIKIGAGIGFVLSLGVFYAIVKWLTFQGEKQTANQFIRGSRLDTPQNVAKQIKKQKMDSDIVIDGVPMIVNSETKHFLVHGTTGSGKTQLISKLLDQIRKRGDRVFLYDKGGVYTSTFYRPNQDKILNPFDSRCENWNLWQEARSATDFENIAESLIPMHGETEPFWVNAARTIFSSVAYTMQDKDNKSIKELFRVLLTSELQDLHSYLAGTEAATLASDKIEKTAISIRSVITTYVKSLRFLISLEETSETPEKLEKLKESKGLKGSKGSKESEKSGKTEKSEKLKKAKFSIRDWICDDKNDGWLFLSSNAEQHSSIKPLLSMWFSMATITLLALPENRNRRLWFICDELPSLHKLPQLPESIAEARKYGGCFVLGMQSYAQLEKVYGRNAGREIFDLMNTAFFFRSPSHDMAELVSQALGSQEIEDMRENYSYGANTIRDGISIGSQRMINQIVTPSEIMDLAEMKCYLRLAAPYPITLLELALDKRSQVAPAFLTSNLNSDKEIEGLVNKYDSNDKGFQARKKEDAVTEEIKEKKKKNNGEEAGKTKRTDDGINNEKLVSEIEQKQQKQQKQQNQQKRVVADDRDI